MAQLARQQLFVTAFNIFTVILLAWFIGEFVTKGALAVPNTLAEIFLLVLVFYAGDKELHRWHHRHASSTRRGEMFVLGWVGIAIIMLLIESFGGEKLGFRVPRDIPLVVWSVIVIFIITEYLKSEFRKRK